MDPAAVEQALPLTSASFLILLALAGDDAHGYAVMQEVERLTGGKTRLGPGTLYRSLTRLLMDRWIVEQKRQDDSPEIDERRRVYSITALGWSIARAEARRLEVLIQAARKRGLFAPPTPDRVGTRKAAGREA